MSYFRTGDPLADFERLERENESYARIHPVCCHCGDPIMDDRMFVINDNYYHIECAEDEFQKWTEDYIEED